MVTQSILGDKWIQIDVYHPTMDEFNDANDIKRQVVVFDECKGCTG